MPAQLLPDVSTGRVVLQLVHDRLLPLLLLPPVSLLLLLLLLLVLLLVPPVGLLLLLLLMLFVCLALSKVAPQVPAGRNTDTTRHNTNSVLALMQTCLFAPILLHAASLLSNPCNLLLHRMKAWMHGRMDARLEAFTLSLLKRCPRTAAHPEKKVLCVTVTVEKSAQSRTCRLSSRLLLLPLLLLLPAPPMARSRVWGSQGIAPWCPIEASTRNRRA
jgi:hypothetical protein